MCNFRADHPICLANGGKTKASLAALNNTGRNTDDSTRAKTFSR